MPAARNLTPRILLLIFGVFCGSTAVIMIKASTEHPFLVASYRLLIAAMVLTPFFLRDLRESGGSYGWRQISWSVWPAVALGVHFMTWVFGARQTLVLNASVIANLTPAVMPFFLWIFYGEKVNRQEVTGTLFTLSGLFLLSGSTLSVSRDYILGDLISFGSMLLFACYLALGRRNGSRISLWLYMVPLYYLAGILCLVSALPFINPFKAYSQANLLLILGLALIPTVFGHTILNYSLKYFRGQVVSVANLAQPLFAGLLGYLLFAEVPQPVFFAAAALIGVGILIVLYSGHRKRDAGR